VVVCAREKKLRGAQGKWVSGHGAPYLGALILELQNRSTVWVICWRPYASATVSFATNFEYMGSPLEISLYVQKGPNL
jgi:hypothetical protein